jgi:hypothetical protein
MIGKKRRRRRRLLLLLEFYFEAFGQREEGKEQIKNGCDSHAAVG